MRFCASAERFGHERDGGEVGGSLTQEGGRRYSAIAAGDHHTDSRLHKGNGEIHDLRPLLIDSQRADGHVRSLVHHLQWGWGQGIIIPSAPSASDMIIYLFFSEPTDTMFPGDSVTFLYSEPFFSFFLFPSPRS